MFRSVIEVITEITLKSTLRARSKINRWNYSVFLIDRSRWPSVGERWIDIYIYKVISFRYDLVAESNLFMASVRGLPEPGVGTIRNWSDKLVEHFPLNLKTPVYPRTERRR